MAATKFLRWASNEETAAQAYVTASNDYSLTHFSEAFAAEWYPRQDVDSKWCAPFFGPPAVGAGGPIAEPDGFPELRDGAETVDQIYWPDC